MIHATTATVCLQVPFTVCVCQCVHVCVRACMYVCTGGHPWSSNWRYSCLSNPCNTIQHEGRIMVQQEHPSSSLPHLLSKRCLIRGRCCVMYAQLNANFSVILKYGPRQPPAGFRLHRDFTQSQPPAGFQLFASISNNPEASPRLFVNSRRLALCTPMGRKK